MISKELIAKRLSDGRFYGTSSLLPRKQAVIRTIARVVFDKKGYGKAINSASKNTCIANILDNQTRLHADRVWQDNPTSIGIGKTSAPSYTKTTPVTANADASQATPKTPVIDAADVAVTNPAPKSDPVAVVDSSPVAPGSNGKSGGNGELGSLLADMVAGKLDIEALVKKALKENSPISEERVVELIKNRFVPKEVKLTVDNKVSGKKVDLNCVHPLVPKLIKLLQMRLNGHDDCRMPVWLYGPAGSGKTTAVRQVAEALSLKFVSININEDTQVSDLLGYISPATGEPVKTELTDAIENGGLVMVDECDAGNANVLTGLNVVIENGVVPLPWGTVKKHKDFAIVAGANTIGAGADRQYLGRNALDKAFITRFRVKLEMGYDRALEERLAQNGDWVEFIYAARKAVAALGVEEVISPRQSQAGGSLLNEGWRLEEVKQIVLWNGMGHENAIRVAKKVAEDQAKKGGSQ